ncbi:hypothetical protein CRU99_07055 [Malaciobacter mytili]|uniref:hypothetical protein n=1 Tax=Malaciobacter mytili TaxID=603050 RepID=UPI00100C1B43|nr:hypothetical protein [Malaciobacter mytili]RXI43582.1 hypothetical protein CRU99_07055 [Malaciobacter mytili]
MKNAFIEHIFIFLLLLGSIIVFVATTSDEVQTTNKISELKRLVDITSNNLAKYYFVEQNICRAQEKVREILQKTKLGKELVEKNLIRYIWEGDQREPLRVTAVVEQYSENTFWYKFIDLNNFNINNIRATTNIPVRQYEYNLNGGGGEASYENIIGTYEIDRNGCITNPRIVMISQKKTTPNTYLGKIKMPPERIFLIADGYRKYGRYDRFTKFNYELTVDSKITIEGCLDPRTYPIVKINDKGPHTITYFQDFEFNIVNNFPPIQIIAQSAWSKYQNFVKNIVRAKTNVYERWRVYARNHNIEYQTDPEENYVFTFEDGPDRDYNDAFISTTRIYLGLTTDHRERNIEILQVSCE